MRSVSIFFFQAEDGIRDATVTGVQTCALPISPAPAPAFVRDASARRRRRPSFCPGDARACRSRDDRALYPRIRSPQSRVVLPSASPRAQENNLNSQPMELDPNSALLAVVT